MKLYFNIMKLNLASMMFKQLQNSNLLQLVVCKHFMEFQSFFQTEFNANFHGSKYRMRIKKMG